MILRREQVPQAVADAYDNLIAALAKVKGKRWDDPAWTGVTSAQTKYRKACHDAGIYPKKGRAGKNIYPTIL